MERLRAQLGAGLLIPALALFAAGVVLRSPKWQYTFALLVFAGFCCLVLSVRMWPVAVALVVASAALIDQYLAGSVAVSEVYEVTFSEVLLIVLLVRVIWHLCAHRVKLGAAPALLGLWALYLVLLLPAVCATQPLSVGLRAYSVVGSSAALAFFCALVAFQRVGGLRLFVVALAVWAGFAVVFSLAGFFLNLSLIPSPRFEQFHGEVVRLELRKLGLILARQKSFYVWPSFWGAFLAGMLPLLVATTVTGRRLARIGFGFVAILVSVALALNLDRGAVLGLGMALVPLGLVARRYKLTTAYGLACIALVSLAALAAFPATRGLLGPGHVWDLLEYYFRSDRVYIFADTLRMLPGLPLFGVGFGTETYWQLYETYGSPQALSTYVQPHNSYLEYLVYAGLPATLAFVAILLRVSLKAVASLRSVSREDQWYIVGLLAGLLALAVEAFFDRTLFFWPVACLWWILLGALEGVRTRAVADSLNSVQPEPVVSRLKAS